MVMHYMTQINPLSLEYSPAELRTEGGRQVEHVNNPAILSQQLLSPETTVHLRKRRHELEEKETAISNAVGWPPRTWRKKNHC